MPAQPIVESFAIPETYAGLRRSVETLLFNVHRLIEEATVRTYWETGRLISGHLHLHEYRPRYGTETMRRLAADLSMSETVLYRCVKFFDCFANLAARPKLLWAHYRVLITVADPAERAAFERAALDEELTSPALAARVQQLRLQRAALPAASATDLAAALLTPKRGTPGLHLIVEKTIGLSVDLGFRHYWPLTPEQAKRFAKGDIVRIASDDSLRAVTEATKADLFAYAATLVRVVDGDTLVVALEISPGEFLEQRLRLRGLDAPELSTPEGKAAKRFVDTLVAKATSIVIRTTKPDKYDRYLADVFLVGDFSQLLAAPKPGEGGSNPNSQLSTVSSQLYLNNLLLESGHAVRKDSLDFVDWEKALLA